MTISPISIVVAALVIGVSFGLMVWGQKYLGEEKGRNPGKTDADDAAESIDNPCRNCGGSCKNSDSPASE